MEFQELGKGVVKRKEQRVLGLFIDGTGLDRATRRLNRKVEIGKLVKGVVSGMQPVVARYYTIIPHEDDSRQRMFLDAVYNAGLDVVVKRLPPKGVTRQVSVDVEMAADIVAFALGCQEFGDTSTYKSENQNNQQVTSALNFERIRQVNNQPVNIAKQMAQPVEKKSNEQRIVTIVCPSRELSYPVSILKELGIDTVTADFGQFNNGDVLKSAAKWIDLSDSETIWRE